MYYSGIDLHKKTCFITTIDEGGKIVYKAHFENREGNGVRKANQNKFANIFCGLRLINCGIIDMS